MGFIDELKRLARPYEDDDVYEPETPEVPADAEEDEGEAFSERSNVRRISRREREDDARSSRRWEERDPAPQQEGYTPTYPTGYAPRQENRYQPSAVRPITGGKVVNLTKADSQVSVVLAKPDKFENASDIADHLREKRTVVLNLENTNKDVARRLIDFLSGVAYAQEGKIKKVSAATYMITPYNVDVVGDLTDEAETHGLYF